MSPTNFTLVQNGDLYVGFAQVIGDSTPNDASSDDHDVCGVGHEMSVSSPHQRLAPTPGTRKGCHYISACIDISKNSYSPPFVWCINILMGWKPACSYTRMALWLKVATSSPTTACIFCSGFVQTAAAQTHYKNLLENHRRWLNGVPK